MQPVQVLHHHDLDAGPAGAHGASAIAIRARDHPDHAPGRAGRPQDHEALPRTARRDAPELLQTRVDLALVNHFPAHVTSTEVDQLLRLGAADGHTGHRRHQGSRGSVGHGCYLVEFAFLLVPVTLALQNIA